MYYPDVLNNQNLSRFFCFLFNTFTINLLHKLLRKITSQNAKRIFLHKVSFFTIQKKKRFLRHHLTNFMGK